MRSGFQMGYTWNTKQGSVRRVWLNPRVLTATRRMHQPPQRQHWEIWYLWQPWLQRDVCTNHLKDRTERSEICGSQRWSWDTQDGCRCGLPQWYTKGRHLPTNPSRFWSQELHGLHSFEGQKIHIRLETITKMLVQGNAFIYWINQIQILNCGYLPVYKPWPEQPSLFPRACRRHANRRHTHITILIQDLDQQQIWNGRFGGSNRYLGNFTLPKPLDTHHVAQSRRLLQELASIIQHAGLKTSHNSSRTRHPSDAGNRGGTGRICRNWSQLPKSIWIHQLPCTVYMSRPRVCLLTAIPIPWQTWNPSLVCFLVCAPLPARHKTLQDRVSRKSLQQPISPVMSSKSVLMNYTNTDWAGDPVTRRSTTGYAFTLNGGAVSWMSRKQPTISLSSTEAEYKATVEAGKDLAWLCTILEYLCLNLPTALPTLNNNESAIALAENPVFQARSKHIEVQYHWIREQILAGNFSLQYVPTAEMQADLLKKALPRVLHQRFCEKIGLMEDKNCKAGGGGGYKNTQMFFSVVYFFIFLLSSFHVRGQSVVIWV